MALDDGIVLEFPRQTTLATKLRLLPVCTDIPSGIWPSVSVFRVGTQCFQQLRDRADSPFCHDLHDLFPSFRCEEPSLCTKNVVSSRSVITIRPFFSCGSFQLEFGGFNRRSTSYMLLGPIRELDSLCRPMAAADTPQWPGSAACPARWTARASKPAGRRAADTPSARP